MTVSCTTTLTSFPNSLSQLTYLLKEAKQVLQLARIDQQKHHATVQVLTGDDDSETTRPRSNSRSKPNTVRLAKEAVQPKGSPGQPADALSNIYESFLTAEALKLEAEADQDSNRLEELVQQKMQETEGIIVIFVGAKP